MALIYNGLGATDETLRRLEKALEERDVRTTLLKIDPKRDNLRGESRFAEIMRQMNFE